MAPPVVLCRGVPAHPEPQRDGGTHGRAALAHGLLVGAGGNRPVLPAPVPVPVGTAAGARPVCERSLVIRAGE